MQPIFFQKAGKIRLNKYVDGKPVVSPDTTFTRAGVVQSIQASITINGTPITDGNSLWNAADPDTSIEGNVVVTLGTMPPDLYAFIMGDTVKELSNVSFPINDEEILIPDTSPYTVSLANEPDTDKPIILVGADASAWAKVSATPAKGQYSVSASTVEFSSANAGEKVFATYNYTASEGVSFGLPKNPRRTSMELIVSGEATSEDESKFYNIATIIDRCKVQGTISPPQQGREPQPVSITFNVQKPRGNKRAVDFVAVPITE
jgi:hypothetical protein